MVSIEGDITETTIFTILQFPFCALVSGTCVLLGSISYPESCFFGRFPDFVFFAIFEF